MFNREWMAGMAQLLVVLGFLLILALVVLVPPQAHAESAAAMDTELHFTTSGLVTGLTDCAFNAPLGNTRGRKFDWLPGVCTFVVYEGGDQYLKDPGHPFAKLDVGHVVSGAVGCMLATCGFGLCWYL